MTKLKPSAALFLLAFLAATPAIAQSEDDGERRDVTIGNPDRARTGVNERGDNEMVIEAKPKKQQQIPNVGPIYVVPQVNQSGTGTVVVPVQPGQPQGPAQPPAQGGWGYQGGVQNKPRPGNTPAKP